MEDNKYYIPEIEEFNIGFEYELQADDTKAWEYYKIGDKHDLFDACTEITRVKYLNKEDIESSGFIFTGKSIDIWFQKEGNFDMYNWTSYKIILHYNINDHLLTIYADDPGSNDFTLFRGICKNISELKTILKQTNII